MTKKELCRSDIWSLYFFISMFENLLLMFLLWESHFPSISLWGLSRNDVMRSERDHRPQRDIFRYNFQVRIQGQTYRSVGHTVQGLVSKKVDMYIWSPTELCLCFINADLIVVGLSAVWSSAGGLQLTFLFHVLECLDRCLAECELKDAWVNLLITVLPH